VFLRLLLLFTVVPLVELWLLFAISSRTSPLFTIGLVVATGFLGAALARRQGWQAWLRIQQQLAQGQPPTNALVDGVLIILAAAVLITPGVLTDLVGFALLVPSIRATLRSRLASWLKTRATARFHTSFHATTQGNSAENSETGKHPVIDTEFTRHPADDESSD